MFGVHAQVSFIFLFQLSSPTWSNLLGVPGPTWLNLRALPGLPGSTWLYLALSGPTWSYLALPGLYMALPGHPWLTHAVDEEARVQKQHFGRKKNKL